MSRLKLYSVTADQYQYDTVVSVAVYATDERDAELLFREYENTCEGPVTVNQINRKRGVVHSDFNAG